MNYDLYNKSLESLDSDMEKLYTTKANESEWDHP